MPNGYYVKSGYMGLTQNGYMLFATISDYYEYIKENEK